MLALGTPAPAFSLTDSTSGETVRLEDFSGRDGLLVMFICAHCPFVLHVESELARLAADYQPNGLGVVAISSNSTATHPQDAPENLKAMAQRVGFDFPYLHDSTQEVAKAYTAACTPDFFLFDKDRRLAYRGRLDASRPGNEVPLTGKDLRSAIDDVLAGRAVTADQLPSAGCNIKWVPGNEPSYVG
jgi:peroxiredoxin